MLKNPEILYLSVIPAVITLFYISLSGKAFKQFYTYSHLKNKGGKRNRFIFKRNTAALLTCAAALLLIISLSGPVSVKEKIRKNYTGIRTFCDYSLLIDISNSMNADDGGITRLEKAKNILVSFIFSNSENSRYSVTVFKGHSAVLLPLTEDINLAVSVIEEISPDMFTSKGTIFSDAVKKAATLFPEQEKTERKIIIATDGEESVPGNFEKNLRYLSGMIKDQMIVPVILLPDVKNGSPVNAGENSHISVPDYKLMEKAAEMWGGSAVRMSDFKGSDFINLYPVSDTETDISSIFLFSALLSLLAAVSAGRLKL